MHILVTGASSGIGKEVANILQDRGDFIYEVSRNSKDFACDLRHPDQIKNLAKKVDHLDALINCAGVGYYGLHETLKPAQIADLVRTNLEGPMILTQQLLPKLKKSKGVIINVSSVASTKINTHGCAYGATKAGLSSFTKSLFAEVRKHGVRCVDVCPDMTKTSLYKNANFDCADSKDAYLSANEVARAIVACIDNPAITSLTLQPQKHQISKKN